ncbi:SRPBCC family protein [Pontimicrobium sp. MEBiC01747]|jgi:uncharacterized membrane protein
MKFTCSVDINASIDKVQSIFLDTSTLKYYQDGFKSKTLISGNEGEKGSKSKIIYEKLELIETILNNNLPEEFLALYEHKHMTNTMRVVFSSIANNDITRYTTEIEYINFNGLFIKVIAKLFPGLFKKQVQKWLNQFKRYVEEH